MVDERTDGARIPGRTGNAGWFRLLHSICLSSQLPIAIVAPAVEGSVVFDSARVLSAQRQRPPALFGAAILDAPLTRWTLPTRDRLSSPEELSAIGKRGAADVLAGIVDACAFLAVTASAVGRVAAVPDRDFTALDLARVAGVDALPVLTIASFGTLGFTASGIFRLGRIGLRVDGRILHVDVAVGVAVGIGRGRVGVGAAIDLFNRDTDAVGTPLSLKAVVAGLAGSGSGVEASGPGGQEHETDELPEQESWPSAGLMSLAVRYVRSVHGG
jgi:hypothetical protein